MTCDLLEPSDVPHGLELCCAAPYSGELSDLPHLCSEWILQGRSSPPANMAHLPACLPSPPRRGHRLRRAPEPQLESKIPLVHPESLSGEAEGTPQHLVGLCPTKSLLSCDLRTWALASAGPSLATLAWRGASLAVRRSHVDVHFGPLLRDDPLGTLCAIS